MTYPVFKIIHCSGCYSYLIGCPETRQAVLVDPKVGRTADYLNFLSLYGLRLGAVVDTHTHADHLSTSTVFAKDGVELWMSHRSACQRPRRPLGDGDELGVGNLRFRALELPGHTPDSIALYGHGMVLTGDSLFVGGLARADFRGSDPAALFDSVKEKLMALPDETLVFPGHGYNDILFSTIGTERASNPALRHASGRDYAAALGAVEGRGNTPDVDRVLALNLEADPELPESAGTAAACCAAPGAGGGDLGIRQVLPEEIRSDREGLVSEGRWIDVRDPYEFEIGRVPGTLNLPLSELGFHLGELRGREPLFLSCRSGVRSMTAARTLKHLGIVTEPVNVQGGILLWQERGFAIDGEPVG